MGMHVPLRTSLLVLSAALALSGCGGGGGALASHAVSLSASQTSIKYGDPVTISWTTSGTDTSFQNGIESCNFADVKTPLNTAGSITDHPAITTTYTMAVKRNDGSTGSDQVTVTVAKSVARFLVVGDAASADSGTAMAMLPEVTSVAPTLSATLPASPTGFDAVVLTSSGSLSIADQSKVLAWLAAGKGVIVVGAAANKIATGDPSNTNVSAIAGWLGGATTYYSAGTTAVFADTDANLGVATNRGRTVSWPFASYRTDSVGAAVPQTVGAGGYVVSFSASSGAGRVYVVPGLAGPAVSDHATFAEPREVFLPGARWAARS